MRAGIISLIFAYGLSQFYRMFLSVLAPDLEADLGALGPDLAQATGLWFLAFAAMQIPVGLWLDRYGPRRTVAGMMLLGVASGGILIGLAQQVWHLKAAMVLIGAGCAPIMISAYYIYARMFPPAAFATLAGATIGFGGLGNISGTAPLAHAVAIFGWRGTMLALAALTIFVALAVLALVRDPPPLHGGGGTGSLREVLALRRLWPVLAMLLVGYAPSAGLSGGWGGPYFADLFGADARTIGTALLVMSAAMIAGSFASGPILRLARSPRRAVIATTAGGIAALLLLWLTAGTDIRLSTALLAVAGFCGANFPILMAHGRAFLPAHLIARGMTLMNLFSIGGVGLMQLASGAVWQAALGQQGMRGAYGALFLFFAGVQIIGLALYLRARDPGR